jgi:hypothetical protein
VDGSKTLKFLYYNILEDSLNAKNLNMMDSHPLITTLDLKSQTRMHAGIKKIIDNKKFRSLIQEKILKPKSHLAQILIVKYILVESILC